MLKKPHAFAIAAAAVLVLVGAAIAAPRLELSESNFDFDYAPQNSQLSHIFWLKSTGDDSLIITRVVPGCSCTKAPLKKNALAVGDSTDLEIIFSTRHYRNHVVKRPHIETNDGSPNKSVQITAYVVDRPDSTTPITVTPYKLDISQFGEKPRKSMSFTLKNVSDQDLKLKLVSTPYDIMDVKIPDHIGAGKSADGSITLKDNALDQEFTRSFTFEVNDQDGSRFSVPIKRSAPTQSSKKTGSKKMSSK